MTFSRGERSFPLRQILQKPNDATVVQAVFPSGT